MARLRDLVPGARARLVAAGVPDREAALDAELLLRHALGWDRATWLTRRDEAAAPATLTTFEAVIARRVAREPVAYIRGVQEFYGRDFIVGPVVLIPRPETELVVDEALRAVSGQHALRIADIGTGSGCLAVTLALECPGALLLATDTSVDALGVARANAARHGVTARVEFAEMSYLGETRGPFDLIVSNPPYVTDGAESTLQPEVREYEPPTALFGGNDGLRDIRTIAHVAARVLVPGGVLVMEIGEGQWPAVREALVEAELGAEAFVRDDLQGIPRVVVATRRRGAPPNRDGC